MVDSKSNIVDIEHTLNLRKPAYDFTLTNEAACMYALSIGIQQDPMNEDDLKYAYEKDSDFQVYPTNAVTVCHRAMCTMGDFGPNLANYNAMMVLHGEEHVTFMKPLVPGMTYTV